MHQRLAATVVRAVLLNHCKKVKFGSHRDNLMAKKKKHPSKMTTDELAAHVFHPKVLKHAKKHLAVIAKKERRKPVR